MEIKNMFSFERLIDSVKDAIIDWDEPFDNKAKFDGLYREKDGIRPDTIFMSYSQFDLLDKYFKA